MAALYFMFLGPLSPNFLEPLLWTDEVHKTFSPCLGSVSTSKQEVKDLKHMSEISDIFLKSEAKNVGQMFRTQEEHWIIDIFQFWNLKCANKKSGTYDTFETFQIC